MEGRKEVKIREKGEAEEKQTGRKDGWKVKTIGQRKEESVV